MKVTKHGDFLYQLTRWPMLFPVNVFLVREDDGFTLIDAGMGGSAPAIISAADGLGGQITRITLTHCHSDHIGSLDALIAALPQAEVSMSSATERVLRDDRAVKAKKANGAGPSPLNARTLEAGDRVGSLEVVAAPGHSADQVAYFDVRDRSLIAGDAFQTRGGIAVSGTIKFLFPFPGWATSDKPLALESARSLRALEPSQLAVGHGDTLSAPLAAMDGAISESERKLGAEVSHA
jgi:glyoxylase-like metal-dependent hydrolase (beta-lactamase superfamily II)